jgi:hypothetical protein
LVKVLVLVCYRWFSWCGVGVGVVFGSLVFGLSRNPAEEAVYLNILC